MKSEKSYDGELMEKGTKNEEIIFEWLRKHNKYELIDFREYGLARRIDVDCGIVDLNKRTVLAEIKSDKYIKDSGNLLFEHNRINHYVLDNMFYLGWGWRSPAKELIVRNPDSYDTYIFNFNELRKCIGKYISEKGKKFKNNISIVETDEQKTTFNFLIPMKDLDFKFKKYIIPPVDKIVDNVDNYFT